MQETELDFDTILCITCVFITIMIITGIFKHHYEQQNKEMFTSTSTGITIPPPSPIGTGHWGTRCWSDDQCQFPFGCNGQWCDVTINQSNR